MADEKKQPGTLTKLRRAVVKDIDSLKANHQDELAALSRTLDTAKTAAKADLEKLRARATAEKNSAAGTLAKLKAAVTKDINSLKANHRTEINALNRALEATRKSIKADLAKLRKGTGKAILREAFQHLLPPVILQRPKKGFEVPLRELFLGPLSGLAERSLTKDSVREAGLSWQAVQAVRKRLASNDPGASQATVHALIVYLSWWKEDGTEAA